MTVKEMKDFLNEIPNENAELGFSICFENPFDEESYQDWYPIETEADTADYDHPNLSFVFKNDKTKEMMRLALNDYLMKKNEK